MQKELRDKINYLLSDFKKTEPLPEKKLNEIIQSFPFKLPEIYVEVVNKFNDEGQIGTDSWLRFFSIDKLKQVNENYILLMKQIPDYFLFGKDAADTGYAFHKINGTFHSFGLMSNFKTDFIDFMGNNFVEFLEYLHDFRYED